MTDTIEAAADERFLAGDSGRTLAVLAFASMTLFAGQLMLAPLLPAVIDALAITPGRAGIALSIMWGAVALCRFPGGNLSDQLSRKTVVVASFGLAIVGFAVLASATTYATFVVGAATVGVGAGLYMPAALALLSDTFVARRGRALGVHEIFINLGGAAAGVVGVAALTTASWHAAFVPVIAALGIVSVLMHRWNDDPYVVSRVSFGARETAQRLLRNGRIRAVVAAYALVAFTWQGTASFFPTFLQVEKGFTPALAGDAFTAVFVVGGAANLVVPALGDRAGHGRVAAAAAVLAAVGLGVLVAGDSLPVLAVGTAVFAVGLASFWPVMTAYLMGIVPESTVGGDYGAISTLFMAVGGLGPAYVGLVAERLSYTAAFTGLIGCLLGGFAITAWLARTPRDRGP